VICQLNHPESGTARGIAASVPYPLARGYRFVRLSGELAITAECGAGRCPERSVQVRSDDWHG
jgi:hypothetical protein